MKSIPTYKKVEKVSGCRTHWSYKGLRCRLEATPDGVTVFMKGGNLSPGDPGEGFTFYRACQSLIEALAFVESLPSIFGPDDAERLGFEQTRWVIYD